ncbi:glycoside hydrolase family 15 protein [Methylomarinum sp. Ch1-1]|uniref:Glycoside hydrolase family 15 protein n=1 Tax=Methylomarinum roseum TaxID=3067653 RepID=A0AAU7NW23_9GAMM|nr:glycoside hydrolase family 15 protein [Methylomarinum sp. Ch1-1]MDP4522793.1 glycoside hydrolase family 15 protein [Methylomarinum sp. Ch1-1]
MILIQKLDSYYREVQEIILDRQDPVSGLLPASTAVNVHGNYTDAWVRDNVYSILAAWGLALAYRRIDETDGRTYTLEQSVVKLMRGLLTAMMRQAAKVERFKYSQDPLDALHAKYDTHSGTIVVGDHEWGHLQLDATSLFLLMLAQMIASGLKIIFTLDEVNFVQNLVHYISRAYRTPDYGIWERGNKSNHGIAELNASSVGMAKAALEAMSGFNLFGANGGQASVIHVISDEIARSRITLESLLPRESMSKEVDSALLGVIGYPAFAVEDLDLLQRTEQRVCEKLQGQYGCKRFLLDGHQTAIEDSHRLYYEPHELKQFMDIECEWPLFFCYLLLNKLFTGQKAEADVYRGKLDQLRVNRDGRQLLPELYRVPADKIEAERNDPGSQPRVPNENIPLVWAQSLYTLGAMIQDGLLEIGDIDPLGRRQSIGRSRSRKIQLTLLAQDAAVQNQLDEFGIVTQTFAEIAPIQIRESGELAAAYTQVGRNKRLGLSGRPNRQVRALGTALLYKLANNRILFLPQFMNQRGFYLALDNRLLVERLRHELAYIYQHWDRPGRPLVVMVIKHNMLDNEGYRVLLEFMAELQQGSILGVPVQLGRLAEFIPTASHEQIDHLHDFRFSEPSWQEAERPGRRLLTACADANIAVDAETLSRWEKSDDDFLLGQLTSNANLYAQLEILALLNSRHGPDHAVILSVFDQRPCRLRDLLEEVYARAGDLHEWTLVRRSAGLLGKYDVDLEQAAAEILVRLKRLSVGREYSNRATFKRPPNAQEILSTIRTYNNNDVAIHIIIQELIIYLGILIKSHPELFTDMHTVRVGHIMQLIVARQRRKLDCEMDVAFNTLLALPPHQLAQLVKETLADYQNSESELNQAETLRYEGRYKHLGSARFSEQLNPKDRGSAEDWHEWREQLGSVGREPAAFFAAVWEILQHCKGLVIDDKLNSKRLLDSEDILAQMTAEEQSFELLINHRLDKIQSPDYRQLTVEALQALALIFKDDPELYVDDTLMTDTLINHAVRISWLQKHPDRAHQYEQDHAFSWQEFYQLPPNEVANAIIDALNYLLDNDNETPGVCI